MKVFEIIGGTNNVASFPAVLPIREALWAAAFGVGSLDGMFDMTPVEQAIPLFDAAINRFNSHPDELRSLVHATDPIGLRGNRRTLEKVRDTMAAYGGTITGVYDNPDIA